MLPPKSSKLSSNEPNQRALLRKCFKLANIWHILPPNTKKNGHKDVKPDIVGDI